LNLAPPSRSAVLEVTAGAEATDQTVEDEGASVWSQTVAGLLDDKSLV